MNKKVMAVAVAGALAVPASVALAQTSTVQIGGSITAFYYQHTPHNGVISPAASSMNQIGVTAGQRTDIMETSEPELFVRGEEKLGGGLSAWFQCTSSLDGMIGGASQISNSGWCARNSGIGFKGSWGNLFMGNWDAPQKLVFNRARGWFGGTNSLTGGSARLLNNDSASGAQNPLQTVTGVVSSVAGVTTAQFSTAITNNPASFFRRQSSSWNYHSPSWNGFQIQGAFSAQNEATGISEASVLNPRMYSLAAHYDNGPLYLGVGYERHNDYNPGNVTPYTGVALGGCAAGGTGTSCYGGGSDTNWTLVAGYNFGNVFNVRAQYARNEYDNSASFGGLKVSGWGVWADWAIQGPHTLRAQFAKIGDVSGTSLVSAGSYKAPASMGCGAASASSCATNTGARVWSVAYSYAFSKRTEGSLIYTKLSNDSGASYSLGKVSATAGNSQTSAGMVLKHRF